MRKAQPKNAEHWKKLSPSTSKSKMGGVDVNAVDDMTSIFHHYQTDGITYVVQKNVGGRLLVGEQRATFALYLFLL